VPPSVLRKLGRYTSAEGFDPETVRKSSGAAAALCTWVRAIELYCTVSKDVEPKRQALKAAEAALAEKTALLGAAFLAYCGPCDGLVRAALLRR
jgi:dynein heavy chain